MRLFVLAALGGAMAGALGGAFRLGLGAAARLRNEYIEYAHGLGSFGWVLPVLGAAIAVGIARSLVRFSPLAGGSGIQYVEAVARGLVMPRLGLSVIPAKFVGGILSLGGGLALGREGPTVQMAARVGALLVRLGRLAVNEARTLRSAISGAGLGVAFNAPLGGAVFVFEEVWRGFPPKLVASTLIAGAMSNTVARTMLGNEVDFPVSGAGLPPASTLVPALVIGAVLGAGGVLYNRVLLAAIDAFQRPRFAPEFKAACVGAFAGLLAWFMPEVVGSGEAMIPPLLDGTPAPLKALLLVLTLRLLLSPLSYATGAPGGLFAPVLVIGALAGAIAIPLLDAAGLGLGLSTTGAVLIGMTAFMAAVIRTPLTGIALVTEMSSNATFLVPMLAASFAAVAVCQLLRAEPIYDSLIGRIRLDRPDIASRVE